MEHETLSMEDREWSIELCMLVFIKTNLPTLSSIEINPLLCVVCASDVVFFWRRIINVYSPGQLSAPGPQILSTRAKPVHDILHTYFLK
jgi:hypothetical protein